MFVVDKPLYNHNYKYHKPQLLELLTNIAIVIHLLSQLRSIYVRCLGGSVSCPRSHKLRSKRCGFFFSVDGKMGRSLPWKSIENLELMDFGQILQIFLGGNHDESLNLCVCAKTLSIPECDGETIFDSVAYQLNPIPLIMLQRPARLSLRVSRT